MRRAQSVRHYARPSLALGADDLGMLREGDESNEDVLRRQLLDKDRENDKVCCIILSMYYKTESLYILIAVAANTDTNSPGTARPTPATGDDSGIGERIQELRPTSAGNSAGE
jgi:hypothetical protein